MFCKLGDIEFELLKTPDGFDRDLSYKYSEHETIESKSKLQFTGEDLQRLNLNLYFNSQFCNPEEELETLQESASEYEALPLIFGNGKYLGRYVIESISESRTETDAEGTVLSLNVRVSLKEWIEDDPIKEEISKRKLLARALKKTGSHAPAGAKKFTETTEGVPEGDYNAVSVESIVGQ